MKKISSYLLNFTAASAGYSEGRIKDDPGNSSGSGAVVATGNDWLYAIYTPIIKYLGALSDTDESETASDFTDTLERIAETLGASAHIPSYNYLDKSYILRDGIIWRANADIDTGVDGTSFIDQFAAGKWDSQVLPTDREQIFGGSIKINTTDELNDVDFGATDCFDLTTGDSISAVAFTKQMDNTFTLGTNQGMLDTGAVAANTKYYLWEIKKDSDSVGDYLASLSASSPTMPAGYTMKRIIGTLTTKAAAAEIGSVAESINRVNAQDVSIGLLRIQNNEILYNAEKVSGTYEYLSTGKAFRTDLSTGKGYEVASGTAGATISSWTVLSSGKISGTLIHNGTALPPKVSSGMRNVRGKDIQEIADVSLGLSDAFGVCSQVFADYTDCWMKILINDLGEYKYILSLDSQPVASLTDITVSAITVASNVATVATSNTTGMSTKMGAIVKGSDIGKLLGKITSVTAGVSFTIPTEANDGVYTGGTYSCKYRKATLHGTGSIVGVNTDSEIEVYSPSPEFNPVYNSYMKDIDGDIDITATGVWRDLGAFFIDVSGDVVNWISYKSGNVKNDNQVVLNDGNTYAATNTAIPIISTPVILHGNDYTYKTSAALGNSFTWHKELKLDMFGYINPGAAGYFGFTTNSTQLTTPIWNVTDDPQKIQSNAQVAPNSIQGPINVNNGDVTRFHADGQAGIFEVNFVIKE